MRDQLVPEVFRPQDGVQPPGDAGEGLPVSSALYRCSICHATARLALTPVDGREPDSREADEQARVKLGWRVNGYHWHPKRVVVCSDACLRAWLEGQREPEVIPEEEKSEMEQGGLFS